MPMKAVLFTQENLHLIITEMKIDLNEAMYREHKQTSPNDTYYFVPDYINSRGETFGWVLIHESVLQRDFTYNADWIKTRFVTITRK